MKNQNKMETTAIFKKSAAGYIFFDILALAFIYLVPAISHLLSFPMYLIEPMRIALVLALVHTSKRNAYVIALSLPLFSFLVSAHPVFLKMVLISGELVLNVWLFYLIFNRTKNGFASILSSIILSKVAYYILKFALITAALLPTSNIIATPLYLQVITTLVFSLYLGFIFWKRK